MARIDKRGFGHSTSSFLHLNCESGATTAVTKMKSSDNKGHVFPAAHRIRPARLSGCTTHQRRNHVSAQSSGSCTIGSKTLFHSQSEDKKSWCRARTSRHTGNICPPCSEKPSPVNTYIQICQYHAHLNVRSNCLSFFRTVATTQRHHVKCAFFLQTKKKLRFTSCQEPNNGSASRVTYQS